ncbi:hypothetical protein [Caloramator sp. Dgby_cultured_2]|uniref:hypothetical protein n=1 Tax=Caloramator sp. Dgby_cultured_2 TaxID=3029174 RepID=UPI00237D393C|nr:hypothetical protein [Caloramator sp. Dgby_cultured_2]WDU82295.1 hypothetical protein PWK10_11380 [Caloramator sp. Dgby_cultured_2]
MSPEAAKLAYRAIIDYLGGNMKKYKELVNKAMAIYKQSFMCECGEVLIEGILKRGKIEIDIMLCTHCGQVYLNGEKFRKCNVRRVNKC